MTLISPSLINFGRRSRGLYNGQTRKIVNFDRIGVGVKKAGVKKGPEIEISFFEKIQRVLLWPKRIFEMRCKHL